MRKALPTTHLSIPDDEWTQVSAIPGRDSSGVQARQAIQIRNEDSVNSYRLFLGDAAPSLATDGQLFYPGDVWGESGDNTTEGHVYAYQASGGALETLAVTEYRNR